MSRNFRFLGLGVIFLLVSGACMAVTGKSDVNVNSGKTDQTEAANLSNTVEPVNNNENIAPTESSPQSYKSYAGKLPKPSGIITKVTMALGTTGDNYDPEGPSTEFNPNATVHAVVAVKNAPKNSTFTAKWLTTDVGDVDVPDKLIDSTDYTGGGSGNLDFTLEPKTSLAEGNYRVEIYLNSKLDQLEEFSVVPNGPGEPPSSSSSGISDLIDSVIMTKTVSSVDQSAENPTNIFAPKDTIHAVVSVKNAPAKTKFTAKWLVTDVGSADPPDKLIDSTDYTDGGSGNIDFSLVPSKPLPKGEYRIEIFVNDESGWTETFYVK
jgi:hypothetical protein